MAISWERGWCQSWLMPPPAMISVPTMQVDSGKNMLISFDGGVMP